MKIERHVPVPKLLKYPWDEMRVGDSFFVKGGDHHPIGTAARQYGLRHQKRFIARKVDGGLRVWRVE